MLKPFASLLVFLLACSLGAAAGIKLDFSTPEGAILMLEDAYRKRDLEAAVAANDFAAQARLMLTDLGKGLEKDADLLKETAETLELAYRAQMKKQGFPNFDGLTSRFPGKKPHAKFKDMLEVTEVCTFPDGGTSTQRILVSKTDQGYRVVIPLK